jgi:enoyl-CoA hydratase/carnithine racemase
MSDNLVLTQLRDGVLTVTLNRPDKRNALSPELFTAIGEAFVQADRAEVHVVLLRANGPVFCAGIDLNSLAALGGGDPRGEDFVTAGGKLQDIFMALERSGKPSVAAVQGAAVGAGLQLALACDLRVAAADARLGMYEIRYGIVPDLGGIHRVVQLCGPARAKDLAMTGRDVSAQEAARIGLVDRVVAPEDLESDSARLVAELTANSPIAVAAAKRLVDAAAAGQAPDHNLRDVLRAQDQLLHSADFAESVSARLSKRQPVFSGK